MCGIFGMSGSTGTAPQDDKFLRNATVAGSVRGLDGTGLVMISNEVKSPVTFIKRAMTGGQFVNDVFDPGYALGNKVHSVIGHNRAATIGKISDETAHPFNEGGLIGVHNGTLRGDWATDLEVSKKCDVDSRGLYRAIAARGIDWTIGKMKGAAALVWCEVESKRVFVYRNSERPLHYVEKNGKVYYASEAGMLSWLLTKAGQIALNVLPFKADVLYEITDGKLVELRTLVSLADPYDYYADYYMFNAAKSTPPSVDKIRSQNGVAFRGHNVTPREMKQGIVEEYAERGFEKHECLCCFKDIDDSFYYEELNCPEVKMHGSCLDYYRAQYEANTALRRIVRDPLLRKTG